MSTLIKLGLQKSQALGPRGLPHPGQGDQLLDHDDQPWSTWRRRQTPPPVGGTSGGWRSSKVPRRWVWRLAMWQGWPGKSVAWWPGDCHFGNRA